MFLLLTVLCRLARIFSRLLVLPRPYKCIIYFEIHYCLQKLSSRPINLMSHFSSFLDEQSISDHFLKIMIKQGVIAILAIIMSFNI